ncbi:MAG: DUF3035 domain-containing protein [Alphaproteobacteria bacterium]|nr:DUF3035 domain-containing protein [Alphaproteobacteria bacterium]
MGRIGISKKTALGLSIFLCGCSDLKTNLGLEKKPPDAFLIYLPQQGLLIPPELGLPIPKDSVLNKNDYLNDADQVILRRIQTSP